MRICSLAIVATLILTGCSGVTDVPRAQTDGPSNPQPPGVPAGPPPSFPGFPGSAPITPGFRATIYGAHWQPDRVHIAWDTTASGAVVLTATNTTGSWVQLLRLRLETTVLGTYSLGSANGSSVTLVIRHGDSSNLITVSSQLYAGGGLAAVMSASAGQIAGRFIGHADGPGGSGEVISFVGEFDLAMPPDNSAGASRLTSACFQERHVFSRLHVVRVRSQPAFDDRGWMRCQDVGH